MSSTDRKTLFLVDGSQIIYRAHYALMKNPLKTSTGLNASAPFGVARYLRRMIEQHTPDYCAVVLDAGDSKRKDLYPEYKSTREGMPDDLREVMRHVVELIDAMGIPTVRLDGYEADDVIGTLARRAEEDGLDTVIVSGDKDLHQLISDRVRILNPGRGGVSGVDEHWVDMANAADRLGVTPDRTIDYLALVGDSSDNVPGAPGIGPKTAIDLLARFGDLDNVLANAESIGGKRGRTLAERADLVLLSRDLVTIRCDLPVAQEPSSLTIRRPDELRLGKVLRLLEFESLLNEMGIAVELKAPTPEAERSAAPSLEDKGGTQMTLF